jgi:prepilin-type N-terminal cleavage/methylation domain-containing protein
MTNRRAARGFTLIETIIYLAIFAVVIGGVVVAAYLLFESSGKVQTRAMVLQEEQFVMATIERLLGEAASISAPAAGGTGSTLTLTTFGGITHTIARVGDDARLDGSTLNNSNVRVTALTFSRTAGNPDGITAEIAVEANAPNGQIVSFTASTTKYRRQ